MRVVRVSVAAALACAAVAGCAGVFGIDDLTGSAFDAGSEATAPADAGVADAFDGATTDAQDGSVNSGCSVVGTKDPPTNESPELDGGDVSFIAALDKMDFGISPDGGGSPVPVGFNLDRFCTTSEGQNSCTTTTTSTSYDTYVLDKNASGLDNAGFNLIVYLTSLGDSFKPSEVNSRLQMGQFGALIVVSGYNGGTDDKNVSVDFFPAVGLQGATGDTPLTFSPSDVWLADQNAYVFGNNSSIYHSQNAYVTGGTLVAQFTTIAFSISVSDPDPRLTLSLNEAILQADISGATGSTSAFALHNGVIAGRWPTRTFFAATAPLKYAGAAVCATPAFAVLENQVCGARDIMSNGTNDNTGKACDALSAGMAFDTYAVDAFGKGAAPSTDAGCGDVGDCK